ncbi:MAG: enolase C-terminal domain-like protein [Bdellovibrionota bacterium]
MITISTQSLSIPLRSSFKHNTAERNVTSSVLMIAERSGIKGYGEACPRTYVTGESVESSIEWIQSKSTELSSLENLDALQAWERSNKSEIDKHTAAYCAVELALLDLFSKEKGVSVESLLKIPEVTGPFQYTAVVSDEQGEKLAKTLGLYLQMGFTDFKFKLSGNFKLDQEKFTTLDALAGEKKDTLRVRIDANNIWPGKVDDAITYIQSLERKFFGIEEPLGPHDWDGLSKLSTSLKTPIILDESLLTPEDMKKATTLPGQWMPNIRISKVGGIARALEIAQIATEAKCPIIVGAQVGETSILSRAALSVVQAYKSNVVAQEGAYGTLLLEKDLAEPEIRFGMAGILKWQSQGSGLGLNIIDANVGA